MAHEPKERRRQHRCVKDVAMRCSFLGENISRLVTLRNFSSRGVYFESGWKIQPGQLIVLRAIGANDLKAVDPASDMPVFSIRHSDPEACMGYRSHSLVAVRRCEALGGAKSAMLYGIGAEIQALAD